jgi:hypothetical protein
MTWGFIAPGCFLRVRFVSMFARAHGPSNRGLVKNGPAGTRSDGMRPDAGPLCRSAPPGRGPLQRLVHVRVWGRWVVPGVATPAADSARSGESAGCSRLRAVPGRPRVGLRPARPGGMSLAGSGVRASGLATELCGDDRMPAAAIVRAGQAGATAATAGPGAWVGGFPAAYRGRAGTVLCAPATGGGRGAGSRDGSAVDARRIPLRAAAV